MSTPPSNHQRQHHHQQPKKQQPQAHHRQIRALYDESTITVYQAYNSTIASAAVSAQKLNASPLFQPERMTWIKPSWNWIMYRSGYSYKDANQSSILALKLTHDFFHDLLRNSVVVNDLDHDNLSPNPNPSSSQGLDDSTSTNTRTDNTNTTTSTSNNNGGSRIRSKNQPVIQWDPERSVRVRGKLPPDAKGRSIRSIQIGVPGPLLVEGIVGIEDVTDRARRLKEYLDRVDDERKKTKKAGMKKKDMEDEEEYLMQMELIPKERVYDSMLPGDIASLLGITSDEVEVELDQS